VGFYIDVFESDRHEISSRININGLILFIGLILVTGGKTIGCEKINQGVAGRSSKNRFFKPRNSETGNECGIARKKIGR
jgi:hypothetical protein